MRVLRVGDRILFGCGVVIIAIPVLGILFVIYAFHDSVYNEHCKDVSYEEAKAVVAENLKRSLERGTSSEVFAVCSGQSSQKHFDRDNPHVIELCKGSPTGLHTKSAHYFTDCDIETWGRGW